MKTKDLMIIGLVGLGAYWLLNKGSASAVTGESNGMFEGGIQSGNENFEYKIPMPTGMNRSNQTAAMNAFNDAAKKFNNIPTIQSGIDVINAGAPIGSLPRTSQTIAKGINAVVGGSSYSGNIASLGGNPNNIKFVGIKQPERDSKGQTNFDRIIAKNKAIRGY